MHSSANSHAGMSVGPSLEGCVALSAGSEGLQHWLLVQLAASLTRSAVWQKQTDADRHLFVFLPGFELPYCRAVVRALPGSSSRPGTAGKSTRLTPTGLRGPRLVP